MGPEDFDGIQNHPNAMSSEDFDRVAGLNDEFRRSRQNADDDIIWLRHHGQLGREFREAVLKAIQAQENFAGDDYRCRDHGTVVIDGRTIDWTIEYLSRDNKVTSPKAAVKRRLVIGGD